METPDQAGAPAEGTATETSSPSIDFSPVLSRVDELASGLGSLRDEFSQHFQQPESEPDDPWASLYGEPEPEPEPEPALNVDALRQALQSEVQGALGPLADQLAQLQSQNDLARLRQEFPELQDPEVAKETGLHARTLAEQIVGADNVSVLTNNPGFISLVRKAMVADQHAASEVPAGGPQSLESGGAIPAGQQDEQSIVQQVMANRRVLPKGLA